MRRLVLSLLCLAAVDIITGGICPPVWADDASSDVERAQIDRLVAQLGDPDYDVRQAAQTELAKLGFSAFDALSAAQDHADLEIASRARYLLRLMQTQLTDKDDPPEVTACLVDFRLAPLAEQLSRMAKLAALPGEKGIPALCRLVRYEESEVLSKHAAARIIDRVSPEKPPSAELTKRLRAEMAISRRAAAGWLVTLMRFQDAPREAMAQWTALVEREQAALAQGDQQTDPQIVAVLARQQIRWACKLAADPAGVAAAIRAVLAPRAELAAAVSPQVDWLVEHKVWEALKIDPAAFAERLARNPWTTLYAAARAYDRADQGPLAEAVAARALGLEMGEAGARPVVHFQLGYLLQREGLFRWAEREYRRSIEQAGPNNAMVDQAYGYLAQMLHDQADDLAAAKAMAELVELLKKQEVTAPAAWQRLGEALGEMNYLYACHHAKTGDREKERKYLEEALKADPTNVEVLIACHHLPESTPEFRQKIVRQIQQVVEQTRQEIRGMPAQPMPRNQLAWLVANTEGDLDEALRASQESVRLAPDSAGYLDTLARCHYAKGNWAEAVKHQVRAAELDPHSGQIAKQLDLFRKTYETKLGKPAPKPDPNKTTRNFGLEPLEPGESPPSDDSPSTFDPFGEEMDDPFSGQG